MHSALHLEQVVSIIRIETICGPPQLLLTVLQCLQFYNQYKRILHNQRGWQRECNSAVFGITFRYLFTAGSRPTSRSSSFGDIMGVPKVGVQKGPWGALKYP